ncbi:MAG: hypothetical protein M3450_08865 [Actinomycetota bacterium]|nr:hypothetical protein [Actinomycetota bacterium]
MPMKPSSIVHRAFGQADWNEEHRWYSGEYQIGDGRVIRLVIEPFTNCVPGQEPGQLEDPSGLASAVAERLDDLSSGVEEVKAFAARELLTTFNENDWCEGSPIDAALFAARLTLTDVTIDQDLTTQIGLPPKAWRLPDSLLSLSGAGTPVPEHSFAGRHGPPVGRFQAASASVAVSAARTARMAS